MFTTENYEALQKKITEGIDNSFGVDYFANIEVNVANTSITVSVGLNADLPNTLLIDFIDGDDEVKYVEKKFNPDDTYETVKHLVDEEIENAYNLIEKGKM